MQDDTKCKSIIIIANPLYLCKQVIMMEGCTLTLRELNEYYNLMGRLARAHRLLASLETADGLRSPQPDGMPHTPGYRDRVGELAVEITDMRESVASLETEAHRIEREVSQFIDSIPDDQARLIFRLRFLRGLSWGEVATIVGGGNTENSVKCICYRYLRRENLQRRDAP